MQYDVRILWQPAHIETQCSSKILSSLSTAISYIYMSEEVWKYLPHVPSKKPIGFKRKSEVTDKEVLNLTGGLFPLKLVDNNQMEAAQNIQIDHWVRVPIVQKNTNIGPIYHWVKEAEEKKLYHGEKFNVDTQILAFTEEEFRQLPLAIPNLSFEKATTIFELLRTYNLNFIVVHDRLASEEDSIQDLKEIYFTVSRELLQLRGKSDHPLASYYFDKKYESNRKYELEKYLMRNKVDTQREKTLLAEIRRLEILIKKEEREQINLKRALKLEEAPDEVFELQKMHDEEEMKTDQLVFSRQQYLCKPLNLPGKVNERLAEVLDGMNIPLKIVATQQNVELYDKLRQKILLMFSIQRYIRKKENERRTLEEKKKRLTSQEEDEKSKAGPKPGERPTKKIHIGKQ